jgi:hypothetical protein
MTSRPQRPEERRLAVGALQALALLAVPATAVAFAVAQAPGAVGALAGLALVGLLFGGSAALLHLVADRGPTAVMATLVSGVAARLIAYAAVLTALDGVAWVHRPSLAIATGIAVIVVLGYELRLLAAMPRLFWIDPDTDWPRAAANATRSQSL